MSNGKPELIPTRDELITALQNDLQSFEYLNDHNSDPEKISERQGCIDDAMDRIEIMLNAENSRVMAEQARKEKPTNEP